VSETRTVSILDSYALLAYLSGEPGSARVKEILHAAADKESRAVMSLINLGEMMYITERERGLAKAQEVLALVEQLPIDIHPVERPTVLAAAHIKAMYPVAHADAFAVAVAQDLEGLLITGDPEFKAVQEIIQIEWIGDRRN
jgi:predicted nucleic acid-binding protein